LLERCGHRDWRLPSSFRPGGLTPVRSPCSHPSEFSFFFFFFFFLAFPDAPGHVVQSKFTKRKEKTTTNNNSNK
jgi:hypothetical protein